MGVKFAELGQVVNGSCHEAYVDFSMRRAVAIVMLIVNGLLPVQHVQKDPYAETRRKPACPNC